MRKRGSIGLIRNGSKRLSRFATPPTVLTLSGLGLMSVGLWLLYPPLAYIVPGGLFLTGGLMLAQRAAAEDSPDDRIG